MCVQVMPSRLVFEVIEPERMAESDVKRARGSTVDLVREVVFARHRADLTGRRPFHELVQLGVAPWR